MNTKVRLVRCPKCQLVLPELPEIPVYKCGGCNTVLQAKHRKPEMKEAGFHYHETDENGPKEADHVSGYSHLKKDTSISHVEESSARSTTQISDNSENINLKQPQDVVSIPVSPGQNCFEYEESSPEKKKETELDKDNSISSQDTGQCGIVLGDGNSGWHRGRRVSADFSTSMELTSNEMEDSSLELQSCLVTEKGRYDTDQCTEAGEIRYDNGKREYFDGSNFSNDAPFVMTQSSPESALNKQRGKGVHLSRQDRADSKIACHEPAIQPVRREAEREADKLLKFWAYKGLGAEESDSTDDNKSPWDDNILADKVSPDAQYVVLPRKLVSQDFKHASSADSLSNLPIAKPRFEQRVKHADFTNSPTRSYYPCNGSVSSNVGMGDQGPTRTSKPPRRKLKHPASVTSDVPPKQGESGVLKSLRSKIEMHHQGYNRSGVYDPPVSHESEVQPHVRKSTFLEANRNTMKYTKYDQENFPETSRYGHYRECRTRLQNAEYVPRLPRDLQIGQNNFPPSCDQGHNSGFCSPDTPLYSGPDKSELLKMINELKDELKRTRISDFRFPSRFSGEQMHTPTIYHEAAPVERVCSDFFRCSCPTKCSQVKYMPQSPRVSRMACLGEAAYYGHRGTCACLHCFPQGCRYSGGLPPLHNMCCNETHCLDHTCQTFNKGCCSSSSSHQLHAGHQFLHDHETKSDDRMHRETEGVRRDRERDSSSKHYMRPAAGGIPLILCYHCSELLQLPADFLLLGRRSHQLKCNACRKIMTFSIQGGKHLVPCIPDVVAPPPSMVDECNDSFNRREMASSSSHPNIYANGELVSYSDNSAISFGRSYSTRGERVASASKSFNDQNERCDSREPYVRRKNSMDTRKGKHKELSPTSGGAAALHRLMGYSSSSQVIRRRTTEEQLNEVQNFS